MTKVDCLNKFSKTILSMAHILSEQDLIVNTKLSLPMAIKFTKCLIIVWSLHFCCGLITDQLTPFSRDTLFNRLPVGTTQEYSRSNPSSSPSVCTDPQKQ